MYTHAHHLIEQAAEESKHEPDTQDRAGASSDRPTVSALLQRVVPGIFFVPLAGPPVFLLLGPWLLLVLLIIPPAAFLITLVLALAVAAGAFVALGALIASPYLLAHHLLARQPGHRPWFGFAHRDAQPQYIPVTNAKGTT